MFLEINTPSQKSCAKNWLILAILSLAMAGLYSLPPVILRGPFFADYLPVDIIFATSLVVHVDLSVLVWFLSIGCMLWSVISSGKYPTICRAAFYLCTVGAVTIALSPFAGGEAIKNNYVPVLQNYPFFLGVVLFLSGAFLQTIAAVLSFNRLKSNALNYGIYYSAFIALIGFICFAIAYYKMPSFAPANVHEYYELLFWGGGHVLQFSYTNLALVVWLFLASKSGYKQILGNKTIIVLLAFNFIAACPAIIFYMSDNHVALFTQQMRYLGGVSAFIVGLLVVVSAFMPKSDNDTSHAVKASLILSIALFGYGGLLAYMISGVNVTIPAHYHGSIVAVTLAFMGFAYHLLPEFGYALKKSKINSGQPYIYGFGQVIHITGLAWMGGYGALRKSAASSQNIDTIAGKLMFFSGGAMAIVGGLLFVIIAVRAITKRS